MAQEQRPFLKRWRPRLALSGVAAGLAVALGATMIPTASAAPTGPAPRFTAVQLVNGILFGEGAAARYAPAPQRSLGVTTQMEQQVEIALDHRIESDAPLATQLQGQLQSGNVFKVQTGLTTLAHVAQSTLDSLYGPGRVQQEVTAATARLTNHLPAKEQAALGTNAAVTTRSVDITNTYGYLYAYIYAAGVLLIIIVAFIGTPAGSASLHQDGQQLARQEFTAYVATHLRTSPMAVA